MKQILLALMVALAFCSSILAQQATIPTTPDSKNKTELSSPTQNAEDDEEEVPYTVISTTAKPDTLLADSHVKNKDIQKQSQHSNSSFGSSFVGVSEVFIATVAIIMFFGFPIFIIFITFYFRYKNRQAKYRLAERAIEAGQPLPENFFKENKVSDPSSQGIRTIFTGLGFFIFLWAITDSFAIGTIGILVMCMGIGQWLIGRINQKKTTQNDDNQ